MDQADIVIIGAGLSGLSVAHFLSRLSPDRSVILFEGSSRPGGAVRSFARDGYRGEWGPHGFLDNNPSSRKILAHTGLDKRVQAAPLGDFKRYICSGGRLVALPQSPPALMSSPLLSLRGKLRLLGDLFIKPDPAEQSVAAWAARRFGRGVLPMVDAAVTGTFAGDMERLSIDAVMPGVRALEKEHGSVLRGLVGKKKKGGGSGLPSMLNFPGGMEELIDALAADRNIVYDAAAVAVRREACGWTVECEGGSVRAGTVVCALPVNRALALLSSLSPPPVREIPEAVIVNVLFGVDRGRLELPKAFGYLAPEREKRFALGAMFTSSMFPDRCPGDRVLLEVLVGGRRHPERAGMDDAEMVAAVGRDLGDILGFDGRPDFVEVLRPASGIPQMEMGHTALLAWRRQLEETQPGLLVCGFGWDGIGMNEMMAAAERTAQRIAAGGAAAGGPELKPVYF